MSYLCLSLFIFIKIFILASHCRPCLPNLGCAKTVLYCPEVLFIFTVLPIIKLPIFSHAKAVLCLLGVLRHSSYIPKSKV